MSVSAAYNTRLLSSILCMLTTQYIMERGVTSSDNASVSMRLLWRAGKLSISMLSQIYMKKDQDNWGFDEHVKLDVSRTF